MMAKRTLRVQKSKRRRMWEGNPATRVVESEKLYHRSKEKARAEDHIRSEITENEPRLMSRILGIDFGSRRVGLAVSDPLGITAQGLETIEYSQEEELFVRLGEVIEAYEVAGIVVGLPLSLDGTYGEKAEEVQRFIEIVRTHFHVPVEAWDERLSTTAAHRTMHEMGKKAKRAKGKIDRIAAVLILQSYLDRVRKDNE
jgi:putative Holliday junction resolvase